MRVIEAAKSLGIHPVTLKRLEKIGVIRPLRDKNGWRRYSLEDLKRARSYFYPGSAQPPTGQASNQPHRGERKEGQCELSKSQRAKPGRAGADERGAR